MFKRINTKRWQAAVIKQHQLFRETRNLPTEHPKWQELRKACDKCIRLGEKLFY
jgi:hypothetical protein